MLIQELFRRVVVGRNQVTQNIATVLAPAILHEYAALPALGGSGKPLLIEEPELQDILSQVPAYTEKDLQAFSTKGLDQSLATHLINGLFAGTFLAERLPEHKQLSSIEQQVWALGYVVHDYTKAFSRKVAAGQLPIIRSLISKLGKKLAFNDFMSDWSNYLDDIVFLAQNTQTVVGANLNIRDYHLQLDKRQRETMRLLSSVTDLLVHITSPSDVHHRDIRGRDLAYNLRQKVDILFGADQAPRFAYHKLLEVRGLLGNLINDALIHMLSKQEHEPFLFFPEGVIYLAPKGISAEVDLQTVTEEAWNNIARSLTGNQQAQNDQKTEADEDEEEDNEEEGQGLRMRRTKDYMKVPEVLYELLDLETLIAEGRRTTIAINKSQAASRFGAEQADDGGIDVKKRTQQEKKALFTGLGSKWALECQLPIDTRVDQLAEYLVFLRHRIFAKLFPKLQQVTTMLLRSLDLVSEISPERAERQRSGTPTGWFYVAARYLQIYPELSPSDLEKIMQYLGQQSLQFLEEQGATFSRESKTKQIFQKYVQGIIEIDGHLIGPDKESIQQRFATELQLYIQSKETNKVVCSLCATSYEAQEQDISTVLFKPQQYSNKSRLDRSRLLRGICPICALDMMLRQVQQNLPASKTQDRQPINLYIYPSYFFTVETAQVVKQFFNRFQNINLRRLLFSHMEKQKFSYRDLFTYDDFLVDADYADTNAANSFWKKAYYGDEDLAALFFVTLHPLGPKRKLTETDTWITPTFLALALPLLLGVKCVATPSFASLYQSAGDFRETTRIDGGHEFVKHILKAESFRIDEIPENIERLLRIYSLHIDVYSDKSSNHWGQLTNVAKDLATDPLYLFQYYDRRQRHTEPDNKKGKKSNQLTLSQKSVGVTPLDKRRYMGIYYAIGGTEDMDFIGKLVSAYAQFYRAQKLDSAYAVLRPLGTATKVVVDSDPRTGMQDLLLLVSGAVNDDMERVRADEAEGKNPILWNKELGDFRIRMALSRQKIDDFAHTFVTDCFIDYCDGDRSVLRERANRIRSAARFYYLIHYSSL